LAGRGQALITVGIKPTEPATGYGYIRVGSPLPPPAGSKGYKTAFHRAEQFVEKPQFDRALEYVNSGHYRWNAGMFVWSFVAVTEGLQKHQPEMYTACQRWFQAATSPAKLKAVLAKDYPGLRRISIDYALMEHAQNVLVARADFPWDDIGAWPALDRTYTRDKHGNVTVGGPIVIDSKDCIIYNEPGADAMAVGVVGVEDTVVVVTRDAVLVMPKHRAQDVRQVVKELQSRQAKQL